MTALDQLSGDAQTFLAKVWASRVHIHHTAADDHVVDVLTLDDCDRLLTESAIRTPAVRLVLEGEIQPESTYTRSATLAGKPLTGLVNPRTALGQFERGATIVLQGLHRYHPPLTRLISELELELGHPCQANAYLTPAGSQGFAVHSDTHDVFVIQTAGTKQWELHSDDGVDEVMMEPGLSMYLPTGTPHAARAQSDVSLHVTIGINQLTWRDVVARGIEPALRKVPDTHLPAGYLDDDAAVTEQLARHLEALADDVRRLDADAVVDAEVRRFLTSRPARQAGGLRASLAAPSITDRTLLRRRAGVPCVLQRTPERPDRVQVLLGDRVLDVPAWVEPALDRIRSRGELRPTQLADVLDPESRLVLCRRLVREGLLEVAEEE